MIIGLTVKSHSDKTNIVLYIVRTAPSCVLSSNHLVLVLVSVTFAVT